MPFFNNLCGNLCQNVENDTDFKINVKLKLNTINVDIKSIEKDISNIKGEITNMKCEMRIGFGNLSNKLDIILSKIN